MKLNFNIGNVNIKGGLSLGPMAGVTDLPFRILCKDEGVSLLCTEMVSAKAVSYNNKNTKDLLKTTGQESPLAVQLFGSEPDLLSDIAEKLSEENFDIIDLNMGCPVPKIVGNKEGSALMLTPKLVEEILVKMVKKSKKPITIKIRKGFDENNINAVEIAKIAESAGVSAIAVHARLRSEYYSGRADYEIIKAVKEAVSIPVIGNGDIIDGISAYHLLKRTNCDGIMIARAARGNPWIFRQISDFFDLLNENKNYSDEELKLMWEKNIFKPDIKDIKSMILRQGELQIMEDGEYMAMLKMRKHIAWYIHGFKGATKLRAKVNTLQNYEELCNFMHEL